MSEEKDLVVRAKSGDRTAVEALFRKHQDDLYRFALSLMKADPARAQDLAQDALLTAFEKLGSLRDTSSFKSWLLGIAYNLHRNHLRRKSMEYSYLSTVNSADEQPLGVEEIVATDEERDILQVALSMVSAGQRDALYLREILGCSYRETASVLQITQNAAKNRVHVGRENMCQAIRKLVNQPTERSPQDDK